MPLLMKARCQSRRIEPSRREALAAAPWGLTESIDPDAVWDPEALAVAPGGLTESTDPHAMWDPEALAAAPGGLTESIGPDAM
jgi:hypothetical protein